MDLMLTIVLHAANPSDPQDAQQRSGSNMASTYVLSESWVYPAFERLAAEGYFQSAFVDLRPWTRIDCARLVKEAEENIGNAPIPSDGPALLRSLKEEFNLELQRRAGGRNAEFPLESLDQRITTIVGRPLTEGYHYAETLVDDEVRPFAEGANLYSGASFRAIAGSVAAYVKTEFQRIPSAPVREGKAEQAIAMEDFHPVTAEGPSSGFIRGRLPDANVSFTFFNNQLTFGRQSLWWWPARSCSTLFSNNAEPATMLRYDRVRPFELPGFFKLLGPICVQLLVVHLAGAQYVDTAHTTSGTTDVSLSNQPFIHGLRQCLTDYVDGFTEDEPFPLNYPTESAWISGFALRYVPRLPYLTIRAEGLLSPHHDMAFTGYYYFNVHYLSGYTDNCQLIDSWIGREGNGEQPRATWQLSPHSSAELSGRNMIAASEFPRGGTLRDLRMTAGLAIHRDWQLCLEEQTEWRHFPLLSSQPQFNAEFTLQPSLRAIARMKS
jgi:hypothetical protein